MACRNRLILVAAALVTIPAVTVALAGDAGEYTFTVLRDGNPIGHHRLAFDRAGGRVEIREETEIEVRLAMIPVYGFEHEARQVWEDGRAIRIDATTIENGDRTDITVRANGDGYIRTVNGRVDKFDKSTTVLALWNKDILDHDAFFSAVEDKKFDVSFQYLGREEITVAGQELEVEHYRMVGGDEREVWYDAAGHVAKVQFHRSGSEIEYIRDQASPRAPTSSCTASC